MIVRLVAISGLLLLAACAPGATPFGSAPGDDSPGPVDAGGTGYVLDDETARPGDPADAAAPAAESDPEPEAKENRETEPDPEPGTEEPEPEDRNAEARAQCLKKGGSFAKTRAGGFVCVTNTSDALKTCTKSSQCEGACLARSRSCSPVAPLIGCHEILTDSGRLATVCID